MFAIILAMGGGLVFRWSGVQELNVPQPRSPASGEAAADHTTPSELIGGSPSVATIEASDGEEGFANDYLIVHGDSSVDYFTVLYPNKYLLHPRMPLDVFEQHIGAAENGVAESMFWVHQSFLECQGLPRNDEQLMERINSSASAAAISEVLRFRMERCSGMFAVIPHEVSFGAQADHWLEKAANNGFHSAKARSLLASVPGIVAPDHPQHMDLLDELRSAVRSEGYPAYYEVEKFLDFNTATEEANEESDYSGSFPTTEVETIAWNIAGCMNHKGCDVDRILARLATHLYPYEMGDLDRLVAEIEAGAYPGLDKPTANE